MSEERSGSSGRSAIDWEARGSVRDLRQMIQSHDREDALKFERVNEELTDVRKDISSMSDKMDKASAAIMKEFGEVRDLIGSRPTWVVSLIISMLLGVVGFLAALAWGMPR